MPKKLTFTEEKNLDLYLYIEINSTRNKETEVWRKIIKVLE